MKKIILTGDRPTGRLHIGHFVGSLKNRVKLQNNKIKQNIIIVRDMNFHTHKLPKIYTNMLIVIRIFLTITIHKSFISQKITSIKNIIIHLVVSVKTVI